MSLGKLAKGGLWLFLGTALSGLLGYFYLFVVSKFVAPDVIGSLAAILSLQSLMAVIVTLGIPKGIQRFFGESLGRKDYEQLMEYFLSAFLLTLIVSSISAIGIFLLSFTDLNFLNLSSYELQLAAILILLGGGWVFVLEALFISTLRTSVISIVLVIASVTKFMVTIPLLLLGFDLSAILAGYIAAALIIDGLLFVYIRKYLRENNMKISYSHFTLKGPLLIRTLRTSLASWIPEILRMAGEKVGVLSVFALVSGSGAGLYFIAFSIASMLFALPVSMLGLLFPLISSMKDGRKQASATAIRIGFAVTMPFALILFLYPDLFLSLVGSQYLEAAAQLRILAMAALISPLIIGYNNYIYAIGKNIHTIFIGLTISVTQLLLYLVLVSPYGELGAAIAYTSGFYLALAAVLPSAFKVSYKINWIDISKVAIVPISIAVSIYVLNMPWFFGMPLLILLSLVGYTRLGIVSKTDSIGILRGFLSDSSISKVSVHLRPIIRLMYGC